MSDIRVPAASGGEPRAQIASLLGIPESALKTVTI
jgi:hypothetical protein